MMRKTDPRIWTPFRAVTLRVLQPALRENHIKEVATLSKAMFRAPVTPQRRSTPTTWVHPQTRGWGQESERVNQQACGAVIAWKKASAGSADHQPPGAISSTHRRPRSGSSERGADTWGGVSSPVWAQRLARATKVATM